MNVVASSSQHSSESDSEFETTKPNELGVCVLVGHCIEAITSAVVLASLGQCVHLYADIDLLAQQLQQYGFEHHLQSLWQMYEQKKVIVSHELPDSADALIQRYEKTNSDSNTDIQEDWHTDEKHNANIQEKASLYWLFLDSIKPVWVESHWLTAFNRSRQQALPVIISGIEQLGKISALAQRLQRAWVYYVPFVFLQDGDAYGSMLNPSLWLLGEKTPNSSQYLNILKPIMQHARATHYADIALVEFSRSSIMLMLATRVSFMNELSRLADSHNLDIQQIGHIMGLDNRVSSSYLQAGWGFGGKALPAELLQLQQSNKEHGLEMPLLESVIHINTDQKELIFRKFWQYFDGFIDNKTVMIWGGGYKAGSGRTINSAIHPLLDLLWSYNIRTLVYSDNAQSELASLYQQQPLLELVKSPYNQLSQTQALFIISWSPRDQMDTAKINQQAIPVFDAQNALTRAQIDSLVGDYMGIGRSK